jgi:IS1 family transposase
MANKRIDRKTRELILASLFEGVAINAVCRMFSVGKHAVLRVIEETGQACEDWHHTHFRDLTVHRVEVDEQWAYVHTHKERMSKEDKMNHPDRGDCWLWASIDADSKAILNWRCGKRSQAAAKAFANDLAARITGRVQITSDELIGYTYAIPAAFGGRVDYAQEHKAFKNERTLDENWLTKRVVPLAKVERHAITGNPILSTSTVCHMERYFLTMRQGNKRCARKTLAYSKNWDNHALTASIHIFLYNLCRVHESLKTTPAVKLGVVERRWTLADVVAMTEAYVKRKEEDAFEDAFSVFTVTPSSQRVWQPQKPLIPWYLDKDSGGPNPPKGERKRGIRYED